MKHSTAPLKAVRGTRDILPAESALFQQVEDAARHIFKLYNFQEIRTPVFEATELFARGVGADTDIVSKEMFTWEDKARAASESASPISNQEKTKAQSLTLRPENTAGVVRAYIEHKLGDKGALQKLYYMGPQFRRERPQKGRYRQFYQIGAEVIGPPSAGSESPMRDAEVILMLCDLLAEVGIREWSLQLNSVGCPICRPGYIEALRSALRIAAPQMCSDCQRRAVTNPLRVLDCKVPEDQPIIDKLPKISAYLGEECRTHFAAVTGILAANSVSYSLNDRMVRGLDYYEKTTWEFLHGGLGAQSALLGGGRYDGLSEALGGPRAPGVGFALGEDRFVLALESEHPERRTDAAKIFVAPLGAGMNAEAAKLARALRKRELAVEAGDESLRLKKSFELAERMGATWVVIVGENEARSGEFTVKDVKSGQQKKVRREALADWFTPAIERRNST